jgi:membrane associated rhomboid family serine protease
MNTLLDEFKSSFKNKDNSLVKLIWINVLVFAVLGVVYVFSHLFQNHIVHHFLIENLSLSASLGTFITKPWTLFTYFFSHQDIFHVLFNLLSLYWFGKVLSDFLGSRRLLAAYILGGLVAGVFYLVLFNTIPYYKQMHSGGLIGASGAIYAVMVAAATISPDYNFNLLFFGPVKIKYIAMGLIFISFLQSVQSNAGGNIAHLGGAAMGYLYIVALRNGTDMGKPISQFNNWIEGLFAKKSKLKVSYRNNNIEKNVSPNQTEIDAILDKINRSGYESLSKEEKQKLFKASQK